MKIKTWYPKMPIEEVKDLALSLASGRITFHICDDFDVGDLPEIDANWDGHTTAEKWARIAAARGIKVDP